MRSLSGFLRICFVLNCITWLNGDVLFAANVEDFRNIARELVPGPFADRLARLVSNRPLRQKSSKGHSEYEHDSDVKDEFDATETDDSSRDIFAGNFNSKQERTQSIVNNERDTRMRFEDLVERVKDRIANELHGELQKYIDKQKDVIQSVSSKDQGDTIDRVKIYANDNRHYSKDPAISRDFQDKRNEYESRIKQSENKFTNDFIGTDNVRLKNIEHFSSGDSEQVLYEGNDNKQNIYNIRENEKVKHKIGNTVQMFNTNIKGPFDRELYMTVETRSYETNGDESMAAFDNKDNYGTEDVHENAKSVHFGEKGMKKEIHSQLHVENDNDNKFENVQYNDRFQENNTPSEIHDRDLFTTKADHSKTYVTDNAGVYDQFDLITNRHNDSYEDYVTPNKEENIYEYDETGEPSYNKDYPKKVQLSSSGNVNKNARLKAKQHTHLDKPNPLKDWTIEQGEEDGTLVPSDEETTEKFVEIKAQTESLWFNDESQEKVEPGRFKASTIKAKTKGTMIPTRHYYKMKTPNYYISLPTVAEKYDSNEPLPERDRQRIVIKHIGNPPASINKKVRLIN